MEKRNKEMRDEKGRFAKGNSPWMTGKHLKLSDEHKKKISLSNIGKKKTESHREKLSKRFKGMSWEQRYGEEMTNRLKINRIKWASRSREEIYGKDKAKEINKKFSESMKGHKVSKETRDKIRQKNLNMSPWNKGLTKHNNQSLLEKSKMMSGKNHHFYGKKLSEDHKRKLKESRSKQIIPLKDTKIEKQIQSFLDLLGIEYYTHYYVRDIENKYQCDIFIPLNRIVIECDGDYWHANPNIYSEEELNDNQRKQIIKDNQRREQLKKNGYKVITLWESEIKNLTLNSFNSIIKEVTS